MINVPDQVNDFNKSSLNAALQLARISLDTTERLMGLQLQASKDNFVQTSEALKAISEAGTNPQALAALRAQYAQTGVDRLTSYSRSVYEVAANAQAQLSSVLESNAAEWNNNVTSNVDKAIKTAPAGSDVAIAAVKSTMAATAAALEGVTKTAKQMASFTDASVKATVDAATAAMKPAA
jgi:phasin family protein